MMNPITLTHCVAVQIYPRDGDDAPQKVVATITVDGAAGDGAVLVYSGSNSGPLVGTAPAGGVCPVPIPPTDGIWLHYVQSADGPDTIDVAYVLDVG